jgi:hypothetical protein
MKRRSNRIRSIAFFFYLIALLALCRKDARPGEVEFLKVLFAPEKINWTVKLYPALSERDKKDLLDAKNALTAFLKTFNDREEDPTDYLTPDLSKKYENRADLYMKEFGAELILEIEIYDFKINSGEYREIELSTLLTETTEGVDSTSRYIFSLQKIGQRWLLSNLYRKQN